MLQTNDTIEIVKDTIATIIQDGSFRPMGGELYLAAGEIGVVCGEEHSFGGFYPVEFPHRYVIRLAIADGMRERLI